eukprot:scpid98906/ scgid18329/ 
MREITLHVCVSFAALWDCGSDDSFNAYNFSLYVVCNYFSGTAVLVVWVVEASDRHLSSVFRHNAVALELRTSPTHCLSPERWFSRIHYCCWGGAVECPHTEK